MSVMSGDRVTEILVFELKIIWKENGRPGFGTAIVVVLTKTTPGSAGGPKELIARGKVDKKKPPS